MAMTKCKECGKEISTLAKTCPHCGASTTPILDALNDASSAASSLGKSLIFIGVIILAIGMLAMCGLN